MGEINFINIIWSHEGSLFLIALKRRLRTKVYPHNMEPIDFYNYSVKLSLNIFLKISNGIS
jgi:hypothetical protein